MPDNRELFERVIADWSVAVGQNLRDTFHEITFEVFTRIVFRSPVNTGRFRGSWLIDVNTLPTGIPQEPIDAALVLSVGRTRILQGQLGNTVNIFNNQPYSVALEFGHSQRQAPAGMVRITLQEIDNIVSEVVS